MGTTVNPGQLSLHRTALVTGANRGLGLETCRALGRRGFRVLLTSRALDQGRAAADALTAEGLDVTSLQLDVSDARSIDALAAEVRASGAALDVLVNNAAVQIDGGSAAAAHRTLATNLFGPLRLTDALAPLMPPGGHVVMVSSEQGQVACLGPALRARFADPTPTRAALLALIETFSADVDAGRLGAVSSEWPRSAAAYRVSKAGLNVLTRVLAAELASRRVRVTAVCPGWCRTMGGPDAERSAEEGAASITWAAASDDGPTGGFFRDGAPLAW